MLFLIYCAIASLLGRPIYETNSSLHVALLGVWLGVGLCYLGVWLAFRLGELAVVGWIFFVIGYVIITASMMGWLALPAVPIVIAILIYLHIQHRRNQQNGLLWVLAVATERNIPLAPGVEAFSIQNPGVFGERAHALATFLHRGKSLTAAIDWVPRAIPWDAAVLIHVGELTNRLAPALREAAESRVRRHSIFRDLIGRIGYLGLVVNVAQSVIGFIAYFIVPKFEAIFKDFGVDLPPVTRLFFLTTDHVSAYVPWLGLAELVGLIYLAVSLGSRGWQGLPLVGRLFRLQHKAVILKSLALVVESGQPIDRAFTALAQGYPSARVQRKLQVALDLVRAGESWTAALDGVGLISPREMGLLDSASRVGNLAWALRALAESGERRLAYRLQIGSQLVFLAALLALGTLVLFFCLALFSPLVHLIERLAG